MEKTGGRWLVGALGVCMVAVGIYFVIKGVRAKFRDELEPGGVGPVQPRGDRHPRPGRLGRARHRHGARRVVRDQRRRRSSGPAEAKGFDGSLRELTESTLGPLVVGFVAVALVVYGLFCVISAPRQRLIGAR